MSKPQELKKSGGERWVDRVRKRACAVERSSSPLRSNAAKRKKKEEQPLLSAGQSLAHVPPAYISPSQGFGIRGCNNVEEKESTKGNYIMNTSIYISLNTGRGMIRGCRQSLQKRKRRG